MAKKDEKEETKNVPAKQDQKEQNLAVIGGQTLDLTQLGAELTKMKKTVEITSEYYQFEIGESVNMYVVGLANVTKKGSTTGEKVPAIRFLTEDGNFVICADAVLVSTLRDKALVEKPYPVQIDCIGQKTTSMGTYKTYKIYDLG